MRMNKPIKNWDFKNLEYWVSTYKGRVNKENEFKYELICVIIHVILLCDHIAMREVQILSLLMLINADKNNTNRLATIKNGEGKSYIIFMFAAYKVLKDGVVVDIVTASEAQSKRNAYERQQIYEYLTIKSDEISNSSDDLNSNSCYQCDVLYGYTSKYKSDILKDEFAGQNIRRNRRFQFLIVDDVDNELIDEICNNHSLVTESTVGFEHLDNIIYFIWQELGRIEKRLIYKNNQTYLFKVPFTYQEDDETIKLFYENKADKDAMIANANDISDIVEIVDRDKFLLEYLKDCIENKLTKNGLLSIPDDYTVFVNSQLDIWISNAIKAKYYLNLNADYVILSHQGEEQIYPIDSQTGVVKFHSQLNDALQQFLQIKHNLPFKAEFFTTNYMSNFSFFNRYSKQMKLIGVTNTFGSSFSRKFLKEIYKIDVINIPAHKERKLKIFQGQIYPRSMYNKWLHECVESIYEEAIVFNRAVLCICKSLRDANAIYDCLRKKDDILAEMLKLYTRNDKPDELNAKTPTFDNGKIIITTYLCTSVLTTKELEEIGGLHLLITFIPPTLRFEWQAYEQGANCSGRGTAKLIALSDTEECEISNIKHRRGHEEMQTLIRIANIDLLVTLFREILFEHFKLVLDELRRRENVSSEKFIEFENAWALWLKVEVDNQIYEKDKSLLLADRDEILNKFNNWCNMFIKNINTSFNSNHMFPIAVKTLINDKDYNTALEMFKHIVSLDRESYLAYYYLAFTRLSICCENSNTMDAIDIVNMIAEAKNELDEAKKNLLNMISQYVCILITIRNEEKVDSKKNTKNEQLLNLVSSELRAEYEEAFKKYEASLTEVYEPQNQVQLTVKLMTLCIYKQKIYNLQNTIKNIQNNKIRVNEVFHDYLSMEYMFIETHDRDFAKLSKDNSKKFIFDFQIKFDRFCYIKNFHCINIIHLVINLLIQIFNCNAIGQIKKGLLDTIVNKIDKSFTENFPDALDDLVIIILYVLNMMTIGVYYLNVVEQIATDLCKPLEGIVFKNISKVLVNQFTVDNWQEGINLLSIATNNNIKNYLNKISKVTPKINDILNKIILKNLCTENILKLVQGYMLIEANLKLDCKIRRLIMQCFTPFKGTYKISERLLDAILSVDLVKIEKILHDSDEIDEYLSKVLDNMKNQMKNVASIYTHVHKIAGMHLSELQRDSEFRRLLDAYGLIVTKRIEDPKIFDETFDDAEKTTAKEKVISFLNHIYDEMHDPSKNTQQVREAFLCYIGDVMVSFYQYLIYYGLKAAGTFKMMRGRNQALNLVDDFLAKYINASTSLVVHHVDFNKNTKIALNIIPKEKYEDLTENVFLLDYDDLVFEEILKDSKIDDLVNDAISLSANKSFTPIQNELENFAKFAYNPDNYRQAIESVRDRNMDLENKINQLMNLTGGLKS